ncbi:polysaccharide pyruvyl transferase family protein [Clostridium lacusfryxellense]|uniref:polysaccharide pyruvyl transferase family protein n=1 Tax=Clostridium lacusfryxellense TaxID=205328 RepID=UPI001C0CB693|nr:polysaccharide pyruvyl transferase family protein [Clostridium lacusfryxellense]MBU3111063.1 polysaccharide pyruvyl transferase family protein [Clostridium lacusfryxellense]
MKTAIITITDFSNIGNRLQNYAVQQVLLQMNQEPKSLRVRIDMNVHKRFKQQIRRICSIILPKTLYRKKPASVRFTLFEQFTRKYILEKIYVDKNNSFCDVKMDKFDYYIVGSDQVWNPNYLETNLFNNYLLTFATPEKRISYAASFGVSELPEEWKKCFAEELSKFKAISVREDAGAKIIKELTGRDVEVLIDPTMMLNADTWRQISKKARVRKREKKSYILKYFLGDQSEERKKYIQSIADKNGLEVYDLLDIRYREIYTAGPDEFLDLIDHAALICTDSFHATTFSILFAKPFLVMNREQEGMGNMGSRIITLLSKLHLERRISGKIEENQIFECDYHEAYQALEKEREKAYTFLKKAMSLE